jgi:hypothetical protein
MDFLHGTMWKTKDFGGVEFSNYPFTIPSGTKLQVLGSNHCSIQLSPNHYMLI